MRVCVAVYECKITPIRSSCHKCLFPLGGGTVSQPALQMGDEKLYDRLPSD